MLSLFHIGRAIIAFLVVAGAAELIRLWYFTYLVGQFYLTAGPFLIFLGGLWPFMILCIAAFAIQALWTINPESI